MRWIALGFKLVGLGMVGLGLWAALVIDNPSLIVGGFAILVGVALYGAGRLVTDLVSPGR